MKTLITTALLAALAITGFAKADEPIKPAEATPAKPAVQKVTTEQLGETLEKMGYAPRPGKNKDGKVVGYWVDLTRGNTTVTAYISVAASGTSLWLTMENLLVFNEKNRATTELLLGFLATHDQLWPAYLAYNVKTKSLEMAMSMTATGFGAPALKKNLDELMDKFFIVVDAYQKVKAAEEKAKAGTTTTGTPNPLP